MQPQAQPDGSRADGFKPKYRHFHPMDRVWLQNPFDHDVVFQVADEYNRPFRYRLRAHQVSELPGGAIATLGVKAVIDELIINDKEDNMLMWDEKIRSKHEANVILRIKSTTLSEDPSRPGEVDLTVNTKDDVDTEPQEVSAPEQAFPGLNQPIVAEPVTVARTSDLPAPVAAGLADVIGASLPSENAVVGANNAGHNDEG